MNTIIRKIRSEEHDLLREFLYHAIYLPEGVEPPPRSVVDLPELQVYVTDFGTQPGDHCLVAEVERKVIGAAWCRIMETMAISTTIPPLWPSRCCRSIVDRAPGHSC